MDGPYTANHDGTISYAGNKIYRPIADIAELGYGADIVNDRVVQLSEVEQWRHISKINHKINKITNDYFDRLGALFTLLPLTTRMISSPGAVYGREAINYTTDTCPITLKWFDLEQNAFLSESSQIYLELALMQPGIDQVFSVYNSFRKEHTDPTHLSEFHHIEYEGKISQSDNESIALGLVGHIIKGLTTSNTEDLSHFLDERSLKELDDLASLIQNIPRLTYQEAQDILFNETKDQKYKRFTMQDNFGSWEEVKLTNVVGSMVAIKNFPLLEVPFYHAVVDGSEPKVADNTDIIWPGYREYVGSGHRVRSERELEEKAVIFNLPRQDYEPYLQTRRIPGYVESSGFGMGWERFLQGLLKMPTIWSVAHFPRGHNTLRP